MATHSSVLPWRIPGMGEPGGLPSVGSHRVGHDCSNLAAAAAAAARGWMREVRVTGGSDIIPSTCQMLRCHHHHDSHGRLETGIN